MTKEQEQIKYLYPGERFVAIEGAWIGDKGTILKTNMKPIESNRVSIKGKRYRRANLIASVWLKKPSYRANLGFKDGNKENMKVENLYYK